MWFKKSALEALFLYSKKFLCDFLLYKKRSTRDAPWCEKKIVARQQALGAQNVASDILSCMIERFKVMVEGFNPVRYSVIEDKNPREIVMLVGDGCKWRKCRFCDYHLDSSLDIEANYKINKEALEQVTGLYNELEVINSGSFVDLDEKTISLIKKICLEKNIKTIHFECHYMHKDDVKEFKPLAWLYFSFGTSIPTATVSAGN